MQKAIVTILLPTILLLSRLAAGQAAPGSLDDQLIKASRYKNATYVQQLLQQGAHIEAKDQQGETALIAAAHSCNIEVVKMLLDRGANIETRESNGETPLLAGSSCSEVVKMLLDKGASIEAKDSNGYTALSWAAREGSADVARLLLDKGANIEASNAGSGRKTALIWTAYDDKIDVAKLLLERGANIEAKDEDGDTALFVAAEHGNTDVVKLLLERGANIEATDKDGGTALMRAAIRGNADVVKLLLEKGADLEAKGSSGWPYYGRTALLVAAENGKTGIVKLLLEKGANLEAKDKKGDTALLVAAEGGRTEVAALLIEKGADLAANNNQQQTAAIAAENNKHPELAVMLRKASEATGSPDVNALAQTIVLTEKLGKYLPDLQKGISIDALLHRAVRASDGDVAAVLIEKGANIETKDEYGQTPLQLAVSWGHIEVVRVLLDKGANLEAKDKSGYTALLMAVGQGRADLVKMLIDKGANLEVKGPVDFPHHGNTALLDAVEAGNINLMKLLLDKGANIEATDKDGETALLVAADKGKADVVKLLLDKGAKIEAKSGGVGGTALLFAAYRGNSDVVKLLLERGANIEGKNDRGETALISAQGEEKYSRKGDPNLLATIEVLQHALSQNPQAKLAELLTHLQKNPYDQKTREALIESYTSQQPLPPIPEEARQLFQQASALMKQSSAPSELGKPIDLLEKALVIAPWWGNAYYNLSRAWELKGKYDFALEQLNYYLELKPSEADAAEARAHIAVIQAEKETVARKEQENEALLAVKYVSGGMTRLRYGDVPEWWHFPSDIGTMYLYTVDEEWPFYVNVLRLPNGHPLAAFLIAQSNNGMYAGDRIGVIDLIDQTCLQFNDFAFGEQNSVTTCRTRYYVNVSNQPNATVTVTDPATGASGTLPVALLYRGRALHGKGIFGGCSGTVQQGGARAMVLEFDCNLVKAAEDPTVNAAALTPTTVKPK